MLEVIDLKKSYSQPVLTGVHLSVQNGEFIGILGENGCGKSTLLEILAGALTPDSGQVLIDGESLFLEKGLFAKKVGYVPQNNPLIEELTVLDNLSLWYADKTRNLQQDLKAGPPAALGLGSILNKKAGALSGGMKKRLSIACALAGHCALLLLDEPSAALDIVCKQELYSYYKEYQKLGGSIIMTSHEQAEFHLCSRLFVMKQGKLHEISTSLTTESLAEIIKGGNENG